MRLFAGWMLYKPLPGIPAEEEEEAVKVKHKARPDALLSLQFWREFKGGNLVFMYTVNDGDLTNGMTKLDYYRFGKEFSECKELNFLEKHDFADFCRGYLENLKDRP